ncbi:MAG: FtsB family cell division protein [Mangrovicoccus sp.]
MQSSSGPGLAYAVYVLIALMLSAYFAYVAVRGELGVLERTIIVSHLDQLSLQRDALLDQTRDLENRTLRLSDEFLDLDLLDEQAREVLGMIRPNEVVINEMGPSGR